MDPITKQCVSPQTDLELTFSLSSKLQKSEETDTNDQSGKSPSDFPLLLTFPKTTNSPAPEHCLQQNEATESTSDDSGIQEKPIEQPQDDKLNVTFIPTVQTNELRDLPEQGFVMAERNLLDVGKDDNFLVPVADEASLSLGDGTGRDLASSDTDTCCPLRKSPEDQTSGGWNLPPANDGEKIQTEGCEIQTVTCGVTFQSDALIVAEIDEMHELEHDEDGKYLTPPSDFADLKHSYSSETGEMANSDSGLQLSDCNLEVNEIESAELIPSVVENCEACEDTAMERSASSELDDICFAKSAREAADHTMPARTSQEPAEGDNDGGSIDVIDPEFQSVFDREAEEKCCNTSETSSEDECEKHSSSSQCPDGWTSQVSSLQNHSGELKQIERCYDENNNNIGHPCTDLQESYESIEQIQSCPDSVNQVPEVDQSLWDGYEMDWVDWNRETQEMACFIDEIESGGSSGPESQEILQCVEEEITSDYWSEPGKQNQDVHLKLEGENDILTMNVRSEENPENEMQIMEEEMRSDISVSQQESEDDVQQENECTVESTNRTKSTLACLGNDQEQSFQSFADDQDHLSALVLSSSDGVVPTHGDFKHGFTLYSCGLDGNETFEKIQLSPDDDDDDYHGDILIDINNIPVSICSPIMKQMQTPQQSITSSCDIIELINLMEPEDYPEIAPIFESTSDQPEPDMNPQSKPSPDTATPSHNMNKNNEFGMKKEFDNVLEELKVFFDISEADFSPSPPQQCNDALQTVLEDTSKCKEDLSSPEKMHHGDVTAEDTNGDQILCEEDPLVCPPTVITEREQEVPVSSNLCQETAEIQKEFSELKQCEKTRSPSVSLPLLEQLSHRLSVQPRRLEPLKTCSRPIRVGLSKRAKTKQLHRCHPYK